jgi:hypothetical protein
LSEYLGRPSIAERHAGEIQLVEQGRVERDQLFTLQAVDHIARSLVEVERLELLRDRVQPAERPTVVILVVALDEPQRQTIE